MQLKGPRVLDNKTGVLGSTTFTPLIRFEHLLEKVRLYSSEADVDLLRRAYVFSTLEHRGQIRHSGEPYLAHPLEVANFLVDMKLDVVAVVAGLLHDVVEDTQTTPEQIAELFGSEVAHVVAGVTKISALRFSSNEERQAENVRKMLLAMVDDIRVILVKLADRLHNMRTLKHLDEEPRLRISQETLDIYAPIASRLGMSKIKNELEDLSFQYLEPRAYKVLRSKVETKRKTVRVVIEELKDTIEEKLQEAQAPAALIEGRIKRLYSIHRKLKRQKIDLDRVYDFVALRVITHSIKDCYAVLGIIHQTWSPVPGRIKDFIGMPRVNGYQSLHTSVIGELGFPFEVQIRTEEMHRRAEEGIAAHWKYKEGRIEDNDNDEQQFSWVRQLLEAQQEIQDPQEFIQHLKIDLYPDEVYIFTPKGEVRSLPRNATALDFAYSIHTDVGHQCIGAKVNGKMVPLRTRLENGSIVEILTQVGHRPSRDWLGFVVTSRARNRIKHLLHGEERKRSIDLGRRLFEKEARRFSLNPKNLLERESFKKFSLEYGAKTPEELFAHIGYGKLSPRTLIQKSAPSEQLQDDKKDSLVFSAVKRVFRQGNNETNKIKVRGIDDLMVSLAKCCNPIHGEKITGYVTRGKGVSVHTLSCPNVVNLMFDPERRIAVEWDKPGGHQVAYTVHLTMHVEDRKGMLAEISAKVSDINTNITNMEARTGLDQQARIDMVVEILDFKHLKKVIKSIKDVDGVLGVDRTARA